MSKVQNMVLEFHKAFGAYCGTDPSKVLPPRVARLRSKLVMEEATEVVDALAFGYRADVAKELADLAYVTYGTAVAMGIDLDEVIAEVHRSNMSKLGTDGKPIYREDGKVLKSENYKEAEVWKVLCGQQMRGVC